MGRFPGVGRAAAFNKETRPKSEASDVAGTVTLDDGNTYLLPADFDIAALTAGAMVTITYEEVGGQMQITAVEQAS